MITTRSYDKLYSTLTIKTMTLLTKTPTPTRKVNILRLILAVVLGVGLPSCGNEFLELENPNQQTEDTFWQNEQDAIKGTNAAYASLLLDGLYMRFGPALLDFRGDDMAGDSPWDALGNIGKFSIGTNSLGPEIYWLACYQGVFRSNQVIENVGDIDMDEALAARLIGEAHFLRGLYYYHLVKAFRNVPLVLSTPNSSDDFYPSQATPEAVWQQIIDDMKAAQAVLPDNYTDANVGRATKGAATAYLGKAYLFNQRWDEAAVEFKKLIDSGLYGLMNDYRDNFTERNENNRESIFEVQFSREVGGTELPWGGAPQPGWGQTSARAITYGPENFGFSDCLPTRWIFDEFMIEKTVDGEEDPRLRASIFYNYPGATLYGVSFQQAYGPNSDKIFPRKYQNDDTGIPNEFDWRSGINERIMRYADVLMMYAECQNELGNTALCAEYVQQVRDRSNLPNRQAEFAAMSQEEMREQLSHERALEFCFEGHRFDDLRRWGWLSDPVKLNILKQRDPGFNGYIPGREYLPIPQIDMDTNPNLVQNPGY